MADTNIAKRYLMSVFRGGEWGLATPFYSEQPKDLESAKTKITNYSKRAKVRARLVVETTTVVREIVDLECS